MCGKGDAPYGRARRGERNRDRETRVLQDIRSAQNALATGSQTIRAALWIGTRKHRLVSRPAGIIHSWPAVSRLQVYCQPTNKKRMCVTFCRLVLADMGQSHLVGNMINKLQVWARASAYCMFCSFGLSLLLRFSVGRNLLIAY